MHNPDFKDDPFFIKKVPVNERFKVISSLKRTGWYYYENDYKAFESHFTPELMRTVECALYRAALANDPDDAEFITKVLTGKNKIRFRNGTRVTLKGRRMSGDMCTSLGNGFTNLMVVRHIVRSKGGSFRGFCEGDDGLFATTVPLTAKDFENLGFTVEIKSLSDPCEGHFCGMTCTEDGTIIKDPRRVFQNFGWSESHVGSSLKVRNELLRAKALSLRCELGTCPIIWKLAQKACAISEGFNPRWSTLDRYHLIADTAKFINHEPTMASRLLMERIFNVPIMTQLKVEQLIEDEQLDDICYYIQPSNDNLHYESKYCEVT